MSRGFQTKYSAFESNKKWRSDIMSPSPIQENPDWPEYKKIMLKFEKHTFQCTKCSMFALKRKFSMKGMCENGSRIAARFYNAKERWMHENPVAYARTVVGGVLAAQKEQYKKECIKQSESLDRTTESNQSLCPLSEKMAIGRIDKTETQVREENRL